MKLTPFKDDDHNNNFSNNLQNSYMIIPPNQIKNEQEVETSKKISEMNEKIDNFCHECRIFMTSISNEMSKITKIINSMVPSIEHLANEVATDYDFKINIDINEFIDVRFDNYVLINVNSKDIMKLVCVGQDMSDEKYMFQIVECCKLGKNNMIKDYYSTKSFVFKGPLLLMNIENFNQSIDLSQCLFIKNEMIEIREKNKNYMI